MVSSARDRFVTAAASLFAARGYRSTSVADIQLACGLTAGSGALYKHFATKQALLEAVVQVHVDTMSTQAPGFADALPDDLEAALNLIAVATWAAMRGDRDSLRVLLRDLDEFPDLLDRVWQGVRDRVYGEFARWLRMLTDRGVVHLADVEATAAVLLASLTYYPLLETLIGRTPGDMDDDRYRTTWVQHALATLVPRTR